MKEFDYAKGKIGEREILIAIPSMIIGVGILTLPKDLAAHTTAIDGVIPILIGGVYALVVAWSVAKIASIFPNQTFVTYTTKLTTKSIALIFTYVHVVIAILLTALEIRDISNVTKQFLLEETPVEVIGLVLFLVVIYAVSGSRSGIFRLNIIFLPIVICVALTVLLFDFKWFNPERLLPLFKTPPSHYLRSVEVGGTSYLGIFILWFYTALTKKPKNIPKTAAIGMLIPICLYLSIFIMAIGVFGNIATANLLYPTIELAKQVEIPGEFFERFESVFFVIWIMTIFNTIVMAFDIAVLAIKSTIKKATKLGIIYVIAPITFIVAMLPEGIIEVNMYGRYLSIFGIAYTVFLVLLFSIILKLRRGS